MFYSFVLLLLSVTAIVPKHGQRLVSYLTTSQPSHSSAPANSKLVYYGGPVISNIKVFTIFWGGSTKVTFASQLESFYGSVTSSPWYNIMTQYKTPSQTIGSGSWIGSYSYVAGATGVVQDTDIQTALLGLINAKSVPAPDPNTYYAIHFAPGVSISQGGSNSCAAGGFCAYHGTIAGSGSVPYIQYGVMPDQGGGCASGCGSDPSPFNNLCSVSSHELAETVTDPAVGLASSNASPLAWYDSANGEIGDLCNAQQGTTTCSNGKVFTVQKQFSNADNDCVLALAAPPVTTTSAIPKTTTTTPVTVVKTTTAAPKTTSSVPKTTSSVPKTTTAVPVTTSTIVKTTTKTTSATPSPSPTGTTCAHSVCTTGPALAASCGRCAALIISSDGFCGTYSWDGQCVAEVSSICKQTC